MSCVDRLAPLVEMLSGLLTVDDPTELIDNQDLIENLHILLSTLDEIDSMALLDLDIDQLVNPAFTIISMIAEMGQQYDELATLPAMIWKVYVKLIRKFGNMIDGSVISKFLEILMSSCEEGLLMLKTSHNEDDATVREQLRLLTFFIQRLTATLVNCPSYYIENPEMQISTLFILFSFFGILHSRIKGQINHPSQPVLNSLFQGLMKAFTSDSKSTIAVVSVHSNSQVISSMSTSHSSARADSLDSQTELNSSHVLRVDLQLLMKVIHALSVSQVRTIDCSNDGCHNDHLPYATIAQAHSFFIGDGISQFIFRCLLLLSAKDGCWSDMRVVSECGRFVTIMIDGFVRLMAHQIVFHNDEHFQDECFVDAVHHVCDAVGDVIAQHPLLLIIWDLLFVKSLGLRTGEIRSSSNPQEGLHSMIYHQLMLYVFKEFSDNDQLSMVQRSFSITAMMTAKNRSVELAFAMGCILADMVKLLPAIPRRQLMPHVLQVIRQEEMLGPALFRSLLLSDATIMLAENGVLTFIREQLHVLNHTATNGLAMKDSNAASALSVGAFVAAVKREMLRTNNSNDLMASLTSNKTIGGFIIRMVTAVCRHLESRLNPACPGILSDSTMPKLTKMASVVVSLSEVLSMHQIPKAVRTVLLDNATKLSSTFLVAIDSRRFESKTDHNRRTLTNTVFRAWYSLLQLIVSSEGESLQPEELQLSFSKIVEAWSFMNRDASGDGYTSIHWMSGIVQLVKSCSANHKAALTAMLNNPLGASAKSFSKKVALSYNGRNSVDLTQDRVKHISRVLLLRSNPSIDEEVVIRCWGRVVQAQEHEEKHSKRRKLNRNGEELFVNNEGEREDS